MFNAELLLDRIVVGVSLAHAAALFQFEGRRGHPPYGVTSKL